jgi:HEPN domain-containing protein
MKPDPREEAERWLRQAENDLRFARFAMSGGFYAEACFTAQQSAEKALKSLAYLGGARSVLGHSVLELLGRLLEQYPHLEQYRETAGRLDQHHSIPLYPNVLPAGLGLAPLQTFTQGQAREATDGADGILREVREILDRE